jgi:hypothetical protein
MEVCAQTTDMQHASGTAAHRLRSLTRQGKARLLTLDALDARTAAAREARNLITTLSDDLGGAEQLSAGERQLVTRAAMTGAIVADFEARWVAGEPVALGDYLSAVNVQRRVLATLGLQRRQRDVTPTLADYLREKYGSGPADQVVDENIAEDEPATCEAPISAADGENAPAAGSESRRPDDARDDDPDDGKDAE